MEKKSGGEKKSGDGNVFDMLSLVINRFFELAKVVLEKGLDRWVIVPALFLFVGAYVFLEIINGPGGGEGFTKFAKILLAITQSSLASVGGWALAAVLLFFGGMFCVYQHRRIREQGDRLSGYKKIIDRNRLSSNNPGDLAKYANKTETEVLEQFDIKKPKVRPKKKKKKGTS